MAGRKEKEKVYIDIGMLFCVFLLMVMGLIMIYSTTAYKSGNQFLMQQLRGIIAGIVMMIVVAIFPFKKIPKLNLIVLGASLVAIIALLTPLKMTINGATRWIKIFGMSVQVAEIIKTCMIIFMANMLSQKDVFKNKVQLLMTLGIMSGMVLLLGLVSSNMSSAIIVFLICAVILFIASPNYFIYILGAGAGVVGVLGFVFAVQHNIIDLGFRNDRIKIWLNPYDETVDSFQTVQALYAIGSGGIKGKGIGEGIQKLNKIPEVQNDMIFSVLCEELGFIGATFVVILFLILILRLMVLAMNATSKYDALIIAGVMAHIALQAVLNIAVVTNSMPNTGVSLPFISCGGSSVLFLLMEIGLVLNVSKHNKIAQKMNEEE